MGIRVSRRRVLAGAAAAVSGVAGCVEGTSDGTPTTSESLDLREANVVDVVATEVDDGYRFDVTLYHDDDGEDGYADRWEVETRDGETLGRRELSHAHGTRAFTRSATVTVPEEVNCVVVRGHDQTHGYGGRAMVTAFDGGTRAVDQGPERQSFADADCP